MNKNKLLRGENMWINRKQYKFLKENAEKNIDVECEILRAKDNQIKAVARAMEEYSSVLKERDELKKEIERLNNIIEEYEDREMFREANDYC